MTSYADDDLGYDDEPDYDDDPVSLNYGEPDWDQIELRRWNDLSPLARAWERFRWRLTWRWWNGFITGRRVRRAGYGKEPPF